MMNNMGNEEGGNKPPGEDTVVPKQPTQEEIDRQIGERNLEHFDRGENNTPTPSPEEAAKALQRLKERGIVGKRKPKTPSQKLND